MKTSSIFWGIAAILAADFLIAKANKNPKITYKEKLPFNYNAQTIPPFGITIQNQDKDNPLLLKHELAHWEQYRKTGAILYYIRYGTQKMLYGYDKMPMELEARKKAGEDPLCINNYTECVRNGTAKTIFDPKFRT
jgi:hypothetical protein